MLSGGAQHRALPRHQIEEIKILNMLFLRLEIELTICHVSSHTCLKSIINYILY